MKTVGTLRAPWSLLGDVLADRIRRRNLAARIVETMLPATAIFSLFTWWAPVFAAMVTLGEFVLYEYVLEPWGLAGHYWERGPRSGEIFTRW